MIQMLEVSWLVLLAGTAFFPDGRPPRQLALPVGALALAAAGLRALPDIPASLSAEVVATLPAGFRTVTAALILVAICGTGMVAIRAGRPGIALVPGAVLTAWSARHLLTAPPLQTILSTGLLIAALAALALRLGRVTRIRAGVLEIDRQWLGAPRRMPSMRHPAVMVAALGTLCSAIAPHLAVVLAGTAVVSWSLWAIDGNRGRWPILPLVVTALLLITYLFLATIAGPESLAMNSLDALPVSPAAETLLAGVLLIASWLLTGLWPLHRWTVAALGSPSGIILLARAGMVLAPTGMEHWRPLAAPLAMVALWHAGARRWAPGLADGAAWLALVSVVPPPAGIVASAWLLPSALTLELVADDGEPGAWPRRWLRGAALLAAGWGGLLALEAGLQGEVVYTVLAACGVVLAIGSGQAMTPSAPSALAPSE